MNVSAHAQTPFRDAIITALRYEAESVLSVEFELVDEHANPVWTPGSHMEFLFPNNMVRQYSLCSAPTDPWRVAVRLTTPSRGGSAYVHESLRPGQRVQLRGPINQFTLLEAPKYRFLAAGIGITPIISMVHAAEAAGAEWSLDYIGKSQATSPFLRELAAYGDRVQFHDTSVLGRHDLRAHLLPPAEGELAYVCGPPELLQILETEAKQWPEPQHLHIERFSTGGTAEVADPTGPQDGFTVALDDGNEVYISEDETILEGLEAAGYAPLNSCREGICGTCESVVVSGDIEHRDSLLSDDEKEANETMMICVSRAQRGCSRICIELQ